jgi:hypothetical protein
MNPDYRCRSSLLDETNPEPDMYNENLEKWARQPLKAYPELDKDPRALAEEW